MAQNQGKPATPVKTSASSKPAPAAKKSGPAVHLNFDKGNYRLLILAVLIVALGFILMSGTTDIYSDTKIVIAPLVVLAGFAVGFFAIFKRPAVKPE
jgi:hypothetical protein